jgi:hypothetical protein
MIARKFIPDTSNPALVFLTLQILDLASTIAFLHSGVQEANPIVRWSMSVFAGAVPGLVVVKSFAALLGIACYRMNRLDLLRRANKWFCVLVLWNIVAIADSVFVR